MLKFDTIEIGLTNRNRNYYYNKGYDVRDDFITIKTIDLPKNSHIKIDVICDRCKQKLANK